MTPPFLTEKDINTAVNLLTTHSYAGCLDLIRSRFHDTENLPFTIKVVKAICLDNLGKQIEANQIIQSLSVTDQFWCRRAFHDHVEQSILIRELELLGRALVEIKPKVINLQVNDICNSKCLMCNIWTKKLDIQVSPGELENILRDPLFLEVESVGVTGGEPTLREDLIDLHNVLLKTLPGLRSTTFITNGFLTNRVVKSYYQIYSVYKEQGKYFGGMVSIDGVGELHDRVRGKKGAFIRAESTLLQLRDLGIPVKACCTIVKENVFGLHDILEWGNKNGVSVKFRVAEFINRLYNSQLANQIRNFELDEIKHLVSFLYLLIETYETDDSIRLTYRSILSILAGQKRITKCPYQFSHAVNIDSRQNFEMCAPKGIPHAISSMETLENQFLGILPERLSILNNYCPNCLHDYHDQLDVSEDWIRRTSDYYDHLMYDFTDEILLKNANETIEINFQKIQKILLVGWYGTETSGDIAILGGILQELLSIKPNLEFVLFSLFPYYTLITINDLPENVRGHLEVRGYHGPLAYEAVHTCDAIIMAGGPLMDIPQTRMIASLFHLFKRQGKPSLVEGCGIGPLNIQHYKENVSIILKLADKISIRDSDSEAYITSMEVSKGVIIRSDPSVTYIESLGIKHVGSDNKIIRCFFRELTHEYPQNVSPQEAMDQLIKFLHKLIKWYPDHKVELWPMHFFPIGNDDREFAKILCAHFGNSHITSELRPKSPLDILKAMSEASFCVCMRYHSVVFASKVGAPFIAIDYTSGGKVNSFLKDTNQLSRMTSLADIDKITKENFQRMLSVSISTNQSTSPQRLKVTHLNTSDIQGGAAIAAYRLSEGLQKIGVESKMIVRYKQSDDISVFKVEPEEDSSLGGNYLSNVIQKEVIDNHRTDISNTLFYWPLVGQDVSEIPLIRSSDVIHLHWISFFQSLKTLERIADLNIPIVWTIHDQWPFTGGCHYSAGCLKYQIECNHCPQIIDYYDTTQEVFLKKRDVIRKMTPVVVTPSSWMADCVRHSAIMKDFQIEVIPNSVNPNVFYPTRKSEARRLLGLDEQGYYLLFGADNIEEKRKGYASLIKALEICKSNEAFQGLMRNGNLRILSFGTPSSELDEYQIPVLSLGYLPTEHKTALAYAAADIFILPSLEDNFPNTVLEAMSCGTPVLANSTGGIPELIDDGENGYLLPVGNYEALSERILQLLKNPRLIEKLGLAGRRKIVKNFTQEMQASRYLELYNQLVPSPQSGTSVNYPALSNVLFVKTLLPEALNNNPAISTLMSTTNELSGQVDQRNQWLKEQNQRISELSDQVTQSDQWLEEQNHRVNELSEQVAQRNQWLEGQNQRMSELSDQVVQRNQWLEEQNQRVNELSEQVAQRNQWLEEQNKRISELSDQVAQRNHWLEEQNQRISELSEQVAQRDQWLEDQKRQIDDAQERIIRIEHYLGIPVVRKILKYLGERISKPSDQG